MLREIGAYPVGLTSPVFVIAEIGLNHGGSLNRANELVDAAADAGASAVKLRRSTPIGSWRLRAPPAHVNATSLQIGSGAKLCQPAEAVNVITSHALPGRRDEP